VCIYVKKRSRQPSLHRSSREVMCFSHVCPPVLRTSTVKSRRSTARRFIPANHCDYEDSNAQAQREAPREPAATKSEVTVKSIAQVRVVKFRLAREQSPGKQSFLERLSPRKSLSSSAKHITIKRDGSAERSQRTRWLLPGHVSRCRRRLARSLRRRCRAFPSSSGCRHEVRESG
jgi:hypothetical protein